MFKKLTLKPGSSANSQIANSMQRNIKNSILALYPNLTQYQDEIFPKKVAIVQVKCQNHINIVLINNEIIFFNEREGPYYPTLRFLHKYPDMMPILQVDRGAIKFVLSGANIMCRGLTSPGARIEVDLPANSVVAIMAEGKTHASAVGLTKMSTSDIKSINDGMGVINQHYLGDIGWVIDYITLQCNLIEITSKKSIPAWKKYHHEPYKWMNKLFIHQTKHRSTKLGIRPIITQQTIFSKHPKSIFHPSNQLLF
ncbi:hypothetical protein DFA_00984 [Cavenderia fasciculata]|uniref:PUA domain-containing protein n=1 Tax=Cavenderia fasciculata TaxID=261658 RepID=F4PUZ3_CACFS|nr:uncharacterized protein DFA_00984 [Cavenderia fasciculata]EGG21109.1 hypothetical protein DFA_00984 [Cavenderia fasciculata]|eukprot:XP_004358959.1 hypothetical protein DFA_00984 [Cavenderia fasciculata]